MLVSNFETMNDAHQLLRISYFQASHRGPHSENLLNASMRRAPGMSMEIRTRNYSLRNYLFRFLRKRNFSGLNPLVLITLKIIIITRLWTSILNNPDRRDYKFYRIELPDFNFVENPQIGQHDDYELYRIELFGAEVLVAVLVQQSVHHLKVMMMFMMSRLMMIARKFTSTTCGSIGWPTTQLATSLNSSLKLNIIFNMIL